MSDNSKSSSGAPENLPAVPASVQVVRHVPTAGRPVASQSQAFTPQMVLMALRRWWLLALPVGVVLAAAAAAVVWYQFEPEYQATALIEINSRRPVIAFDMEANKYSRDDSYVATQLNLLGNNIVLLGSTAYLKKPGSKSVVQKLLDGEIAGWEGVEAADKELIASRSFDISSRQVFLASWLSERISVRQAGKGSDIYALSFTSSNPEFSQALVNTHLNTYFDVLKAQRELKDDDLLNLLRDERDKRRPELTRMETELKQRIADEMRTGAFVELAPEAGDPRLALADQFLEAELEKAVTQAQSNLLTQQAATPAEISEDLVDRAIDNDDYVLAQRAQMRELARLAAENDSVSASGDSPESRKLHNQINAIVEQLNAYREEARPQIRQDLITAQEQQRAAALAVVAARQKNNEAILEALRRQQDEIFDNLSAGSKASIDIARKKFELELERDVLGRIESRIVQLQTESAAPAQVELWRLADKPVEPLVSLPYKQWLITILPALLAPFLLAIAWERILQRIHGVDALEERLNLEVLGEIARFPRHRAIGSKRTSSQLDDALQIFEESVDTLGTSLRLSQDLRHFRVLAVTSAAAHEGKTSVASQLAISISQATHAKTLLIDGDMRSPDLHRVFQTELEPGLKDVLSGDCELSEAIVTGWSDNLDILPAGKLTVNPHRLLANGTARDLFAKLAEHYQYIIVDTPPVLAAGESMILCEAADATLMCAMWDVSRTDQVRRACKRLANVGVQPTGTILNGVPTGHYSHRYGKYHAYAT